MRGAALLPGDVEPYRENRSIAAARDFPAARADHAQIAGAPAALQIGIVTGSLAFEARRSTGNTAFYVPEAPVVLRGGKLSVEVGPNEVLTLRSQPV